MRPRVFRMLPLILIVVASPALSLAAEEPQDPICRLLFDTYIVPRGKENARTVLAAGTIIADRAWGNGFWKVVLNQLDKNDPKNDPKEAACLECLRILGLMLAKDADARDYIRRVKETGEIGQWRASIELGTPVVERLVARAEKADRSSADHYAIALARARDAAANGFFREVLKGKDWENRTTARFFSALALAEQGDAAGFEWLIANCENNTPDLTSVKPSRAENLNLGVCCIAALQVLAGKEELKTKADFDAWWKGVEKPFVPKAHVLIVDP